MTNEEWKALREEEAAFMRRVDALVNASARQELIHELTRSRLEVIRTRGEDLLRTAMIADARQELAHYRHVADEKARELEALLAREGVK